MRLLHAGLRDVALRRLLPKRFEDARAIGRAARRKFVPLHGLSPDQYRGSRSVCLQDRQRPFRSAVAKWSAASRINSLRVERREIFAAHVDGGTVFLYRRTSPGALDCRRDRARTRYLEAVP